MFQDLNVLFVSFYLFLFFIAALLLVSENSESFGVCGHGWRLPVMELILNMFVTAGRWFILLLFIYLLIYVLYFQSVQIQKLVWFCFFLYFASLASSLWYQVCSDHTVLSLPVKRCIPPRPRQTLRLSIWVTLTSSLSSGSLWLLLIKHQICCCSSQIKIRGRHNKKETDFCWERDGKKPKEGNANWPWV